MQNESDKLEQEIQKLYGGALSRDELSEAKNNLVGFFELLIEIDQENKKKSNENNRSADFIHKA